MTVETHLNQSEWSVREQGDIELTLSLDTDLDTGETIELQFPNSWSLKTGPSFSREYQSTDPFGEFYTDVSAPGIKASFDTSITGRHLNHPEGHARHGRHIIARLRDKAIPAGTEIVIRVSNTYAPDIAEKETIWLKVKGALIENPPELTVKALESVRTKIIVPSTATPGETISVLIVSLDQFSNVSSSFFEEKTLLLSDGTTVQEGLCFQGSTRVETTIHQQGVYRFKLDDVLSNPIKVSTGANRIFWGDIHIHTKLSHDAEGSDPYGYARDAAGLDFAAVTDHWESLGPNGYRILEEWAEAYNTPNQFVTLLGDERNPRKLTNHHNIYFRDLETFRSNHELTVGTENVDWEKQAVDLKRLDPDTVMILPHHTGIGWGGNVGDTSNKRATVWNNWEASELLRPAMEIYSHHGQCEMYCPQHALAYETNRMRNPERRGNLSVPGPYYAQDFWMDGKRIGAFCSSDVHSGQGGKSHGGIAAVSCQELTREAVFDAFLNRQCYGTTGERILIELSIAGAQMGQVCGLSKGDPIPITVNVYATDILLRVEILRYRFGIDDQFVPFLSYLPKPESMDAELALEDEFIGPCVYYARVTQEPIDWLDMAWTSPIWIDETNEPNRKDGTDV